MYVWLAKLNNQKNKKIFRAGGLAEVKFLQIYMQLC